MYSSLAGVHARIQGFYSGGGGVEVRQQSGQRFFVVVYFSPELILQLAEGVQWFNYRENYTFLRIQSGSSIFQ